MVLLVQFLFADNASKVTKLTNNINNQGTISFILETDKTYKNGLPEENYAQTLIDLPGLATCVLDRSQSGVFVVMQWQEESEHIGFYLLFTELPKSDKYHFLFTWDSKKGLADGYFNGIPFRTEWQGFYKPWMVKGSASEVVISEGQNKISDVVVLNQYSKKRLALKYTPKNLKGQNEFLIVQTELPKPIDLKSRKGKLLYSIDMDKEEDVKDWIFEGPGQYEFQDNSMILSSKIPNPPDFSTGHYNFWCPHVFPDKIIIEWEIKPMVDVGACHIYFASKGKLDEDIFSPGLPERDGHFAQYINGEINNYYIIYFSNIQSMRTTNMATTWLTKSSKQSLLALGKIGLESGKHKFHKARLIKDGSYIQFQINGKVILDYRDSDENRYAPALKDGHISFRQMAATIAAYKNFNVWELK